MEPARPQEPHRQRVDRARLRLLEVAPSAPLGAVLTATLDLAEELTGSQIGFLHFVEDDQDTLWLQAWSTNTTARMCTAEGAGSHYPVQKAGVWADCIRLGRPVVHNDYATAPGRRGMPEGHATVTRELTVPVRRGGRVVAVLGVGNKPSDYDEADVADVLALADLAWDVAARKRAEEALSRSEARYRALFESMRDGLAVVDITGRIIDSNETYRRMVGHGADELRLLTYRDLTPERWHAVEQRIVEEQVLPRGFSDVYEKEYRRKDGTVFPVELRTFLLREDGRPAAMWAIVRDVTERRRLQSQLAVASRLAAMGTLVSGVAHEVNNPLAATMADQGLVLELVRGLRSRLAGDAPVDRPAELRHLDDAIEALEEAQDGAGRIARIVKNLTTFGRPDSRRERIRLDEVVTAAMRWMPAPVRQSATIQVEGGGAPAVLASMGQIEQVVVNLVTNAAYAYPPGAGGTVRVRVCPGEGDSARLEVIDQGEGIEPALLERIFDPFFTTRPSGPGRGTGLGLAISHAIVTAHGGTISVASEPGKGSTFRVELPAAPVA